MKNSHHLVLAIFTFLMLSACGQPASIINGESTNETSTAETAELSLKDTSDEPEKTLSDGNYEVTGELIWTGRKIGQDHTGTIELKQGVMAVEGGQLVAATLTADMTTIQATDLKGAQADQLNTHLMSDEFFGAENYPEALFDISTVRPSTDSTNYTHVLEGDLTIKEVTAPLTVNAIIEEKDGKITASGLVQIDRAVYDVQFGSSSFFEGLGDNFIDDLFDLEFNLTAS